MSVLWRATAIVVAVLVFLIGGVTAAIMLVDWNSARGWAEGFLSTAAGREVRVGYLDVEPAWRSTRIVLRDVVVANADWGADAPLAEIAELRLTVLNWPLLRGQIDLPEVTLGKPEILAQVSADGRANWDLGVAAEAAGEAVAPEDRTEFPFIGRLTMDSGALIYQDARRDLDLQGTVTTATGETVGNIEIALEGRLEDRPVRLDFKGGSLLALREADQPYPLELSIDAGETRVRATGTAMEPVQLRGFDIDLSVSGPSMAEIFPIFGIPLPPTAPYAVKGHLRRDGEKWRFDDFSGHVDDSDLRGWLTVDYTPERPVLQAELESRKLDFHDLGGLIGLEPKAGEEVEVPSGPTGLLPETPLDVERLKAMDMDVRLRGEKVVAHSLPIDSLDMRFVVVNGRLHVEPLVFNVAQGRLAGAVTVDAQESPPVGAADLVVRNLDLQEFFRDSELASEMGGRFSGHIDLVGRGRSLADMLGVADGTLVLSMSDGKVSGLAVEAIGLDLVEALALVIQGDVPVGLRCAVLETEVADGVARVQRGAIDTTDSLLIVLGEVDLHAETLDVQVEAREKDFSLIDAAAPVAISGPFTDPAIRIGGLDPLPFFEMGEQEDIDCARLLDSLDGAGEQ